MTKIKISISPSQQIENSCSIEGCNEQQHMFLIGQQLYNILKLDNRFDSFLTTKLAKMSQRDYLIKCVQETEQWQRNEGIRISLHSDGGYTGSGCSVFYFSEISKGKNLAKSIYNKLTILTPWKDMSCYARPELYEIKKPSCPAILVETSFHDQLIQAQWIHNNTYQIAYSIYQGILEFYGFEKQNVSLDESVIAGINVATSKGFITEKARWTDYCLGVQTVKPEDLQWLFKKIALKG